MGSYGSDWAISEYCNSLLWKIKYSLILPPLVRKTPLPWYISLLYAIHYLGVFCTTALFSLPVPKLPNLSRRQAVCCFQQLHHDSFPERSLLGEILVSSITTACAFATKSVKNVNHCQSWYFHQCYGELPFWHWTKKQKLTSQRLSYSRRMGAWSLPDMKLWKQVGPLFILQGITPVILFDLFMKCLSYTPELDFSCPKGKYNEFFFWK